MRVPNQPVSPITEQALLNEEWRSYFERLTQFLLFSASIQELSDTAIASLTDEQKKGFIYDTTNDEFFIALGGVLRQIPII